MDDVTLIAFASLAFLAAGVVKGAVGLGLPTAAIGLTTLFLSPRVAIALILAPMIVSNLWQVARSGDVLGAARRYAVFAAVLGVGVWLTTLLASDLSDRLIFGVMGGVIVVFVLINLRFRLPPLPERFDRAAQVVMGAVAGVIGGVAGVWAPPMAIYLMARQVSKDEFVRASGLLIFLGSAPLAIGYIQQGFLTPTLAAVSVWLVAPTLAGFAIGERLRLRLSGEKFRLVFLYVFLVLGLNLLRRGIWG